MEKATFGAGCFWCVEAVFQRIEGVEEVLSGFSGGHIKNPAYREVVTGRTGHAEVIQIHYDPEIVSFDTLLEVFFKTHDPTTLNRQGNDVGTQYRSAIYYHNDEQKKIAEEVKGDLEAKKIWASPIVTEIAPFEAFYPAEEYHKNYFNQNQEQPYCSYVIQPKIKKLHEVFADRLKEKV